ncbi:MAG TPA: thiamine-binding protein [Frankiaceae bacterium]|nr:thiamine-binding protein [Frankiaceae bacterium]
MLVAFSVSPLGGGEGGGGGGGGGDSVGAAVAEAVRIVRASGLPNETNAMFTLVEGEWDEVMDVIRRATDAVAAVAPRVSLVLKADIRAGTTGALRSKVETVERHLTG